MKIWNWIKRFFEKADDRVDLITAVATNWALSVFEGFQEKFSKIDDEVENFVQDAENLIRDLEDNIKEGATSVQLFTLMQLDTSVDALYGRLAGALEDLDGLQLWINAMKTDLDSELAKFEDDPS